MKQSAVEWLYQEMTKKSVNDQSHNVLSILEQAKEMEKQQIVDGCNQTEFEDIDGMGIHETITKGEQYYNETYKGK